MLFRSDRQTDGQTDRQTDRKTDRQTDSQTDRKTPCPSKADSKENGRKCLILDGFEATIFYKPRGEDTIQTTKQQQLEKQVFLTDHNLESTEALERQKVTFLAYKTRWRGLEKALGGASEIPWPPGRLRRTSEAPSEGLSKILIFTFLEGEFAHGIMKKQHF